MKAPIDRAWRFVRDPAAMAQCVPGIEKIDVIDDRTFDVVASARVSFLTLTFTMRASITEVEEPRRLRSHIEGRDSRLGERIKMTAELTLDELAPTETQIVYRIDMAVFGRLASLGLNVMKGKAKQIAEEFARNMRIRVEASAP